MLKFKSVVGLGSLVLILALSSCYRTAEKTVTRSYEETFEGIEEIRVEGKFLEVSYEGQESANSVFLNAYVEASENSGLDIKYRKSGSKLIIEVVGDTEIKWNFGGRTTGYISLTGPENIKLDFQNSSGSLEVLNVSHPDIHLKVNSGSINAMGVEAEKINLTASSGSIKGEGLTGNVIAEVNSGSIKLLEVEGNVRAKASSGSLRFENVGGRVDGKVNSGNIRLLNVKEMGTLESSSGSIKAENSGLGPHTSFKANSGSANIQTNSDLKSFNFNLTASSGSLRVGNQKSGKNLHIDNGAPTTIEGRVSSGSLKIVSNESIAED